MKTQTTYPDIERCACSLLSQHAGDGGWMLHHPDVREYVLAVIGDPSFQGTPPQKPEAAHYDATYNESTETKREFFRYRDAAAWQLAGDVVQFRRQGRPTGDTTSDVMFGDSPIARVTSSLAADIVSYAGKNFDAYAKLSLFREMLDDDSE